MTSGYPSAPSLASRNSCRCGSRKWWHCKAAVWTIISCHRLMPRTRTRKWSGHASKSKTFFCRVIVSTPIVSSVGWTSFTSSYISRTRLLGGAYCNFKQQNRSEFSFVFFLCSIQCGCTLIGVVVKRKHAVEYVKIALKEIHFNTM